MLLLIMNMLNMVREKITGRIFIWLKEKGKSHYWFLHMPMEAMPSHFPNHRLELNGNGCWSCEKANNNCQEIVNKNKEFKKMKLKTQFSHSLRKSGVIK
jgi:hypothetical protein